MLLVVCIFIITIFAIIIWYKKSTSSFYNESFITFVNNNNKIYNKLVITNTQINIPNDIYQVWHSKNIPSKMQKCIAKLKDENPEFNFHLYDEDSCRTFIKTHFDKDVLEAYNLLVPSAYKADLWRYCVLYINGGIYLDVKYESKNGFKFIQLVDKEYFVLERPGFWKKDHFGIYNGLIITKQSNRILHECIKEIVKNVKNKYYGINSLYPTGPGLVGEKYFSNHNQYTDFELFYQHPEKIIYQNTIILQGYPEYRKEQYNTQLRESYHTIWAKKQIYN